MNYSSQMGLVAALLTILLGQSIAYEIFEEEKRQQLYPFPRIGRSSLWDFVEDKRLGGLMPFPRVGRTDGKRQGLIPFPRIGRSIEDEYDDAVPDIDDLLSEAFDVTSTPIFKRFSKLAFQPRIGRRKRSIRDEDEPESGNGSGTANNLQMNQWQPQLSHVADIPYYYFPDAQPMVTPRVMRGMFEPRVGKRPESGSYGDNGNYEKRALIPRVGRGDPSIQTRAMFQPRIGRALIPRVGRSEKTETSNSSQGPKN